MLGFIAFDMLIFSMNEEIMREIIFLRYIYIFTNREFPLLCFRAEGDR